MARIDIKLDENEDIDVSTGDFQFSESDEQHKKDLIRLRKGEFRRIPTLGVGIINYQNAPASELSKLKADIKATFVSDGYSGDSIKFGTFDNSTQEINIDTPTNANGTF